MKNKVPDIIASDRASEANEFCKNKYNEISYKSQKFMVPSGYSGSRIDIIEQEDKIELYFKEKLLIIHPYNVPLNLEKKKRKISKNYMDNIQINVLQDSGIV